ncbi:MAG: hypothetical protein ACK4ZW_06010 [Blastomonas sp.]
MLDDIIGKWKLCAGLAALVILACNLSYCTGRKHGRDTERASWQAKAAKAEKAAQRASEAANARDEQLRQTGRDIITKRKELDDAVANLPDQGPSARQRARICAELRRQGSPC